MPGRGSDEIAQKAPRSGPTPRGPGRPRRDPDLPLGIPVGMRLRLIREHRGLDQAAVRKLVDVAPSTYSHWETGKTYPTIDQVVALCRGLNVSADVLLGLVPLVLE